MTPIATCASAHPPSTVAGREFLVLKISGCADAVAFHSLTCNLVDQDDTNGVQDVF